VKLNHINIKAGAELLLATKEFYQRVLGFEDGFRPKMNLKGCWLYSEGAPLVHLSETKEPLQENQNTHLDHVAFEATDLLPFLSTLEKEGIEYTRKHQSELNLTQLFFRDPAGNKVEVGFKGETI